MLGGMTWARGFIFFGSDVGKQRLREMGFSNSVSMTMPPLVISTFVQIVNQPLIRASISLQDPASPHQTVPQELRALVRSKGVLQMWHGLSAGILKTVPKYSIAIVVKDLFEAQQSPKEDSNMKGDIGRSAIKSVVAGVSGALATNPIDVLRNEMFKTDQSLKDTLSRMMKEEGTRWAWRGWEKNMIAVALPVALTIYLTDACARAKASYLGDG